jgi:hypothetical protein
MGPGSQRIRLTSKRTFRKIVVGKAQQLHDRIEHFRQGRYTFGGTNAQHAKPKRPLLAT